MSNEKSLPDGIVELIARHGLEGYGLYMYIVNLGDSFIVDDEFLENVAMIDKSFIFKVINSCLEIGLIKLRGGVING